MIQRRLVFGSLIVLFLLACAPASVVIASDQWCEDDPPSCSTRREGRS